MVNRALTTNYLVMVDCALTTNYLVMADWALTNYLIMVDWGLKTNDLSISQGCNIFGCGASAMTIDTLIIYKKSNKSHHPPHTLTAVPTATLKGLLLSM